MKERVKRLPKGILLDVDGTITNTQKIVTPRTAQILAEISKRNVKIGVCTARHYAAILKYIIPFFSPVSLHIVAGGGQIVSGKGEVVWEKKIPHEDVVSICQKVQEDGAGYVFGQGETLYVSSKIFQKISQHPWKIDIQLADQLEDWSTPLVSVIEINNKIRRFLSNFENVNAKEVKTSYNPPYFDITAEGVDKASAASLWARKQGIHLRDVLAIGDSTNDIELLKIVGQSAAMGQSPQEVKSVAQVTIKDTDEDGLAQYLEKLFNL